MCVCMCAFVCACVCVRVLVFVFVFPLLFFSVQENEKHEKQSGWTHGARDYQTRSMFVCTCVCMFECVFVYMRVCACVGRNV